MGCGLGLVGYLRFFFDFLLWGRGLDSLVEVGERMGRG